MADWIRLQNDIRRDSRIKGIAARLPFKLPMGAKISLAVGAVASVWSHFDDQSVDGFLPLLTRESIDEVGGVDGLAALMELAGWLEITDTGARLPRFEKYNGETSKKRAEEARRKAHWRARREGPNSPGDGTRSETNVPPGTGQRPGQMSHKERDGKRDRPRTSESESEAFSEEDRSSVAFSDTRRPTQRLSDPPDEDDERIARAAEVACLLADIRSTTGDHHSDRWFLFVIDRCPAGMVHDALSRVKSAIKEPGRERVHNAGALFNTVIKSLAEPAGVDLEWRVGSPKRARSAA